MAPLIGRTSERAKLAAVLAAASRGTGGVVLVGGEAGVGKSRLVTEVLRDWNGGVVRGSAVAGCAAYQPLGEVLRGLDLTDQSGLVGAAAQRLGSGDLPAVVVLEDLHWADAATTELIPPLANALRDSPVLLLVTYRTSELPRTHPLRRMRADLRRSGLLTELTLGPLDRAETRELLASVLRRRPPADLAETVHRRSDGIPFYIEELAAALADDDAPDGADLPLPESVLDAVLAATAFLRARHEAAVEFAAVLGLRVDLPVLADLTTADDVDVLLDAGLIHERAPDIAEFRHALVRDALYRSIPWARRRARHRRAAERLTALGAAPQIIAEHWLGAAEHALARPQLLAAADRHCAVHAYRDAASLGRRALEMWPEDVEPDARIGALEKLAHCAELCGEYRAALENWAEVAQLRRGRRDVAGTAEAFRRVANAASMAGDWDRCRQARETAAAAFTAAEASGESAVERLALAEQLDSAGHLTAALEQVTLAVADAESAGRNDLKVQAMAFEGAVRAELGEPELGVALARQGLELALAGQQIGVASQAYYDLAAALLGSADYAAAAEAYASGVDLCRAHGENEMELACVACMAVALRLLGDWDRALTVARGVLDDDCAPELPRMVATEETALITVLRGDRRRSRPQLRRTAEYGRAAGVFGIEIGAIWASAVAADLDTDAAAARRTAAGLLDRCQAVEGWTFALPAMRWVASFLAAQHDRDELARCHRMTAAAATHNSSAKMLSMLAHAGGELALADGEPEQACAQFSRSVELLQGITAPFEQALGRLRWGVALAAAGERTAAADAVSGAYRTARQLGARPLARGCATALAGMGEQVDRRLGRLAARALEPGGLTRREKEVLRLLAGGRTNRQIAQQLFLSPRTVDMHVRNLLTKLDCPTRTAAAAHAADLGLLEPSG